MRIGKVLFLTLLVFLLGGHFSSAATIVVSTTIQAAIDSSGFGDTIVIPAGNYNEQIVINGFYDLTITGSGPGVTTIDGTGLTGILIEVKGYGSKFTLKNLTVDGANVIGTNISITEQIKTATIMNCEIKNAFLGIFWSVADKVTVKNCLVQNHFGGIWGSECYNTKIFSTTVIGNSGGIVVADCHNTLIKKNLIVDNVVGLNLIEAQRAVVQQNIITGSTSAAINHDNTSGFGTFGNVYSKNRIQFNTGNGVYVTSGFPTIIGNLITDNGGTGFLSDASTGVTYSTLMKNTIVNNAGGSGVYMEDSSGYLSKNTITTSSNGVLQLWTAAPVLLSKITTLMGNKITNNNIGVASVNLSDEGFIDAVKNIVVDNAGGGFALGGGQGFFLEKNKVAANGGVGLAVGGGQAMINKNLVFVNDGHGIISGGIFSVIYKNKVNANNGSGIIMDEATHVDGNKVLGNDEHGIDGSDSMESLIENNKVLGNGDGATYYDLYDDGPNNIWLNNKINTYSLP